MTGVIKYLGSKRLLLPRIVAAAGALPGVRRVLDLFAGTSRVGHAFKSDGYHVIANDHNTFAHVIARCYVQTDASVHLEEARQVLRELNQVGPSPGYFTRTFCHDARYVHPRNGARVDAIRSEIALRHLSPDVEAICLTSLMEATDRVDSTTGVQMAYLKSWSSRSGNDLELRVPDILPGVGTATKLDAETAASAFSADLAYLDPPYKQHSYRGNYHVWETLVCNDQPPAYGIARKRIDCRSFKSEFNSKRKIHAALERVVDAVRTRYLIVSFSNEGFISRDEMETLLSRKGRVAVFESDYNRYVGARIGIHNPQGKRVGRVSHLRNKEYLFVVAPQADHLDAVRDAIARHEAATAARS